jgi:hypothetical protein
LTGEERLMARRTALVLLLMLGHLVLMATPVHARALIHAGPGAMAALQPGQHASKPEPHGEPAVPLGAAVVLQSGPAAEPPADCRFEPAPPPGGPSVRWLAAQGPSLPLWPAPSPLASVRPAACATGPPSVLVSQPFLQVFRN